MTYKKTWLSYVIWAAFTCITGVMLASYIILGWTKYLNQTVSAVTAVAVLAVFAVIVGIYFLLYKGITPAAGHFFANEHTADLWAAFLGIIAFTGALWYRIFLYLQMDIHKITETVYYQNAMITSGKTTQGMVHGAAYLYTSCLSLLFSFLGNKVQVGIWLQIVLQMVSLLLVYFLIKRAVGRIAGYTAMICLAASCVYANQIFTLTPEVFFFVLYLAGLFLIISFIKDYANGSFDKVMAVSGALLTGIIIGMLTFLDAAALSLLILPAGIFALKKQEQENEKGYGMLFSIGLFFLTLIMSAITLAGMFLADAVFSEEAFLTAASNWYTLYQSHLSMKYLLYQTEYSIIESMLQVLLASFYIIGFWNQRKEQRGTPWICLMLLLAPTPAAMIGVLPYQVFSIFVWSVLAGIGLEQCFVADKEPQAVKEVQTVEEMQAVKEVQTVEEPQTVKKEQTVEENVTQQPEQQIQFIENPLPLPKKHKKRTMDYQYEITEDMLTFDIDIKEDDDFDI